MKMKKALQKFARTKKQKEEVARMSEADATETVRAILDKKKEDKKC